MFEIRFEIDDVLAASSLGSASCSDPIGPSPPSTPDHPWTEA